MNKKTVYLFLTLITAASLVACGGGGNTLDIPMDNTPISSDDPVDDTPTPPVDDPVDDTPTPPADDPVDDTPTPPADDPVDDTPTPPADDPVDDTPTPPADDPVDDTPEGFSWNDPSVRSCTNRENGPVKVFIMAGQSNMIGHGIISPDQEQLDKNSGAGTLEVLATQSEYSYLVDDNGDFVVRDDVWVARRDRFGSLVPGEWGASRGVLFGPEIEFGKRMGDLYDNQVLLIKNVHGGVSLAEDFRPPSSGGTVGPRYTEMLEYTEGVLTNIEDHFPGYQGQGFEIAGFAWFQGWSDRGSQAGVDEYQENMVNFVNDVRSELDNEDLPFVIGVTGAGGRDETNERILSLVEAQLAVPGDNDLNDANVATADTRDFYFDEADSPLDEKLHWNKNAESYILIGGALADTMKPLICQ